MKRHGATRVLLGGLCGGGITAQLAASRDIRGHVQGVIALGLPALTIGPPGDRNVPQAQVARGRLRNYARKLMSPAARARVFRDFAPAKRQAMEAVEAWLEANFAPQPLS